MLRHAYDKSFLLTCAEDKYESEDEFSVPAMPTFRSQPALNEWPQDLYGHVELDAICDEDDDGKPHLCKNEQPVDR